MATPSEAKTRTWTSTAGQIGLVSLVVAIGMLLLRLLTTRSTLEQSVLLELSPKLSNDASIIFPDSADYRNATRRWAEYQPPTFGAVVVVTTEVVYASKHNVPFLATSGKHGDFSTLQQMQNGIQIDLRQMNKVKVSADGNYATISGGALSKGVVQSLAAAGKRAVTGICECTGMGGPMLGGGHGFLQGQYELLADQLIDARLVLANGTAIQVSEESNPDLLWALRGAGHNFGIVIEFTYKVHDVAGHEDWAYEMYHFKGSQAEALFEIINALAISQHATTIHLGYMMNVPTLDPGNAVFMWVVLHDGPSEALSAHTRPMQSLRPLSIESGRIPYAGMARFFASDLESAPCQPGFHDAAIPSSTQTLRRSSDAEIV